jgi:hypothetical protein
MLGMGLGVTWGVRGGGSGASPPPVEETYNVLYSSNQLVYNAKDVVYETITDSDTQLLLVAGENISFNVVGQTITMEDA